MEITETYLRTRSLIPFIVAHWEVNMIGILTAVLRRCSISKTQLST